MAGNFRERALESSERELENTVLLLARHFDQQFQDLGAIQEDFVAYVKSAGIDTSEQYRRRLSGQDIHAMLKAKIGALSYVGGINLFDSDGALINSANVWPRLFQNLQIGPPLTIAFGRTGVQPYHRPLDHRPRPQDDRTER